MRQLYYKGAPFRARAYKRPPPTKDGGPEFVIKADAELNLGSRFYALCSLRFLAKLSDTDMAGKVFLCKISALLQLRGIAKIEIGSRILTSCCFDKFSVTGSWMRDFPCAVSASLQLRGIAKIEIGSCSLCQPTKFQTAYINLCMPLATSFVSCSNVAIYFTSSMNVVMRCP